MTELGHVVDPDASEIHGARRSWFHDWRAGRFGYVAPGEIGPMAIGIVVVLAVIVGFFLFASRTKSDTWLPVLVFLNLFLLSLPICSYLSGKPRDNKLFRILVLVLLVKMSMAGPRYYLTEGIYGGEGDAGRYWQAGSIMVTNLKEEGKLDIAPAELAAFPRETRSVGYVVGAMYLVFGATYFGGFVIFSWISWLGMMFFLRAFQVAFPNAPPYFLATLFFLPSLMFWPSGLGKEPPMVFLIGLLTLGAARILSSRKVGWGMLWVGLGGLGMLQIRPHLLLICAAALGMSLMAKSSGTTAVRGVLLRGLVILIVLPLLSIGVSGLDSTLGDASIGQALDDTVQRTEIGGSAFETSPVRGPQDLPVALLTVLYRPFFFEASSANVQIAALEGMLLLALTLLSVRWLWQIGPVMYRNAFSAYCGAWVLCFVVAFSNLGNAGILARQRVQMFPILMILVAAAKYYDTEQRRALKDEAADPAEPIELLPVDRQPALARPVMSPSQ